MKYKLREMLGELYSKLDGVERKSMSIFARKQQGGMFALKYIENGKGKQISLKTRDKDIANRILTELKSEIVYGDTELGAVIQLNIAKLTREQRNRTWSDVHKAQMDCDKKRVRTLETYHSAWNNDVFIPLKDKTLVETTKEQIMNVYKKANSNSQRYLHLLYNYAKRSGWLVSPNLVPPKDWADERIHVGGNYASIADEDHFRLLAFMQDDLDNWQRKINDACCHNPPVLRNIKAKNIGGTGKTAKFSKKIHVHGEDYYRLARRDKETIQEYHYFLQLLWGLGASNVDVRELTTDNIDWDSVDEDGEVIGHVIFKRKKWKGFGKGNSRTRMAIYFPMTQALRDLLRPLYAKAKKLPEGKQYLLPKLVGKQSSNITRIFHSYLKAAGIKLEKKCRDGRVRKLVIHSYRYRMAERLYEMGYTEREACMLMGHNDKAVHQAYSKNNAMKVKSMDKMAKEMGKDKIIKINPNKKVA